MNRFHYLMAHPHIYSGGRAFRKSGNIFGSRAKHFAHFRGHPWSRWGQQGPDAAGANAAPDPQVQSAQACLAQSVDPSVPQDGVLGPRTTQAIRTFQSQKQLPPSGSLDADTVAALQAACSGSGQGGGPPDQPQPPGQTPQPGPAPPRTHSRHELSGESEEAEFPFESRLLRRGYERGYDPGFREDRYRRERPRRWYGGESESESFDRPYSQSMFREAEGEQESEFRPQAGFIRGMVRSGVRRVPERRVFSRDNRRYPRSARTWGREWISGIDRPRIRWVQSCLAQLLGGWVLQDGMMGPNTQAAIRAFQEQQQLPATGFLDNDTLNALQVACSDDPPESEAGEYETDPGLIEAQHIAAGSVPGMKGVTIEQLVDKWRRKISPEIPMPLLLAFIKFESGGNFNDATHEIAFYELGLFQTPAGLVKGPCASGTCTVPPPGREDPNDPSPWALICHSLGVNTSVKDYWKDPETQVRVGLTDLEGSAKSLRSTFGDLFPNPGSDWDLRMNVMLRFALGGGFVSAFLRKFRKELAALPEDRRWSFLVGKSATVGKNVRVFGSKNVDEKMSLAAKLGYRP